MLSVRKAHPAVRVLAMTMICALCLVWVGAIQQRSNAIAGSLLLGAAGAAAAGSVLPVVIAGTLLLALGVAFVDRDALIMAAGRLGTALGDLFDRDMAASTVVQEPATGRYKLKTYIGDDTWEAARSWVAQEYDLGENSGITTTVITDFPIGSEIQFTDFGSMKLNLIWPSTAHFYTHINYYQGTNFPSVEKYNATYPSDIKSGSSGYYNNVSGTPHPQLQHTSSTRFTLIWNGEILGYFDYSEFLDLTVTENYNLHAIGAPDIVDNPTYDYRNARSGAREIVVPLVAAAADVDIPDVSIDGDDTRKWVVPDVGIDNLVGAVPADVPAQDVGGVLVAEGVQVDTGAKTDAQTATDAAAADETQSSLAGLFFSKFPFCIPFDVLQAFKLISAPAVAPRFEWDGLSTLPIEWHGSTKIVFDMGEERWQVVGQICRWTSLVGFCLALMLGTRRLMKW